VGWRWASGQRLDQTLDVVVALGVVALIASASGQRLDQTLDVVPVVEQMG
jgi:hypothetical protein